MTTSSDLSLDQQFCRRFRVCVGTGNGSGVWISDRTDLSILNYLNCHIGRATLPTRIPDSELETRISQCFGTATSEATDRRPKDRQQDPSDIAAEGQVVRELNEIISACIQSGASDIHFEPGETGLLCRARIDGVLTEHRRISPERVLEVVSRIKIMSGLDIAEKRRPQDGRIRFSTDSRLVDIRVSVIPTQFGEKAVLRLLDKQSLRLELDGLGFTSSQLHVFRERISIPNGIILVTGPTGSGKTTTLYSVLQHLKSSETNISTVEDPIEYDLEGVNQTQVKPEINLTFSAMLRAILRQDPNIIMIGEIRDRETLDIAIQASLTGHLVLSTVHTNSAVATVTRLLDMGAEPYQIASSLKLIVAQRLVRRLCPDCITSDLDDACVAAARRLDIGLKAEARSSRGCDLCNQTGHRGRIGIYEVLPVDDKLCEAISSRASEQNILSAARENQFRTMTEVASDLINTGVTSSTELLRELSA